VQDWDFAKEYGNYRERVVPVSSVGRRTHGRFRPSEDAPFRWPTSWKWVDRSSMSNITALNASKTAVSSFQRYSHENHSEFTDFYPINPMNAEEKCDLLVSKLNIRKIAFYGDSLTESQFKSFLNLFGTSFITSSPHSLVCPLQTGMLSNNSLSSTVEIPLFFQRDSGGSPFPHDPRSEYSFSPELLSFLQNPPISGGHDNYRTLAIFNIGAHYHNTSWYHEDMNVLLHSLQNIGRSNDIYFFRTNVPGHRHCNPTNPKTFDWIKGTRDVPYNNIDEFLPSLMLDGAIFDWDKFPMWNDYSRVLIKQFNSRFLPGSSWKNVHHSNYVSGLERKNDEKQYPIVHLLDVFEFTSLRRDGHGAAGGDCLHYENPGPVDWWNHLLFSYLNFLSDVLGSSGTVNCRPFE